MFHAVESLKKSTPSSEKDQPYPGGSCEKSPFVIAAETGFAEKYRIENKFCRIWSGKNKQNKNQGKFLMKIHCESFGFLDCIKQVKAYQFKSWKKN